MRYLLDTNICIYIMKKRPESVIKKFQSFRGGDIGISSVTLAELNYGVAKSQRVVHNKNLLEQFLVPMELYAFDCLAAEAYGHLRAQLEKKGRPIGAMDLMIAAHALSLDMPIVTNNIREFKRVTGLKVENWI